MIVNRKYTVIIHYFTLAFLLLLGNTAPVFSQTFQLTNRMDNVPFDTYIRYIEDPTGEMKLDDIHNLDPGQFKALPDNKVNIGYSSSTFWLRIDVRNDRVESFDWILESRYPLLDYITLYIPAEFGFIEIESGDMLPFKNMPIDYYNFASRISSPSGESALFIKIKSEGSLVLKFRAWDYDSFLHNIYADMSRLWLLYGIIIALFCYNCFIYIVSKDKAYLFLSLFIFSTMILTFIFNGMARKYLWPDLTWWSNYSHPIALNLTCIFLIKFTQAFLNTKTFMRFTHKLLNYIVAIISSLIFISLFISYNISTKISVTTMIITPSILIIFTMIPMFWINRRMALYYLCSWLFFSLGIILLGFRSLGILHDSFLTERSYQIGMAFSFVFLSIGVADKLGVLKKENEKVLSSLKESESRYRLFFETAHDAIMYCINDIPVFANRNMLKMTGYSSADFYKKNVYDFFISENESEDNVIRQIKKVSSGEIQNTQFEALLINRENLKINVLISISYLSAAGNRGIFMIISDISSLKNASNTIHNQYQKIQAQFESMETLNSELVSAQGKLISANIEIEKEKEFLSATLLSIGDGVIAYDTQGKIFLINNVAEEMTGITGKNAIGKNVREILHLTDELSKDLFFDTLGTVTDKYRFNNIGVPFNLIDKDGNERIVEINSAIITLDNKPQGIVLALRDVTIKSRIDTELIKMSKLESIGILAGGIAHDFNNLLTGISGNVSMMKNHTPHTEEMSDIFQNLEKAVDRATGLTKQLLTFAKGGEPILVSYSLKDIITESVKFIIKNPDIKTEFNISENLHFVLIDPNQISQAINNLLINSIQAMHGGGKITIEASNVEGIPHEIPLKSGNYVQLKISDNGSGIPEKNLGKIFDPFFSTKSNGTGLGLTSTYSIIKKHRGYIEVTSVENIGTTFKIYLKSSPVPEQNHESVPKKIDKKRTGNILIMDDESYILEVLLKMLKHKGFDVDCAKNGEEAVKMYTEKFTRNQLYDYVILDLTVYGGMGGKEAISALKKIDPGIKAIVSSGYSDNTIMANYKEYGFSGVLTKPYAIEDVIRALTEIDL